MNILYEAYKAILGQFICLGLGFMFYLLCLDSCLQTYVLRKIKTSIFMLCLSQNITRNETGICSFWAVWAVRAVGKNQVLTSASYVMLSININHNMGFFHG